VKPLLKHVPRLWQILIVLACYGVVPALPFRRHMAASGPVRLRMALEHLGGAWIKLGQMLALRFDLLPAAYCDELFKLMHEVTPFPYAQVCTIVRQELGAAPESVFASFASEPFAAASIGQVHRATTRTGQPVAVKVQRPSIRQVMQRDIALMYAVARIVDGLHLIGATRSRVVIDEFARWTADELDYRVEAQHANLLYEQARGERLEKIARVYGQYSTSRVLTSELIVGIPLIEILAAVRAGDRAYLHALAAQGYDLDRIARHLDWNMLNQVYVFGCFHADLHPANLFVLPDNAIGYVDFGTVGRLPEDVRTSLTRYSWLLFQGSVEGAVKELMRWLAPTAASDAVAARQALIRAHEAYLYNVGYNCGSSAGHSYAQLAVDIMQMIQQHALVLSPSVVAYLKMLVTLGAVRHQLAPTYDLPRQVRRFFGRLLWQQGATWLDPRQAVSRAYGGSVQVRRALEFVEFVEAQQPLIARLEGRLVGLRNRITAVRRWVVRLGLLALVVGGALYFVLADPNDARAWVPPQIPFSWVRVALLVVLSVLILSLAAQARRLGQAEKSDRGPS
jgi:predicted unusual protein kinase regulating ubiquinone biosynthesis (AarF/ABC1/UbiB family)